MGSIQLMTVVDASTSFLAIEKLTNNIVLIKSYTLSLSLSLSLSSSSNVHSIINTLEWIKIAPNCCPPQTSSISTTVTTTTTTTTTSIPIATANQSSCFNNDNADEACADFGATITIVKDDIKLNNEITTLNGPSIIFTTKNIVQAKARGKLRLPNLPTKSKIAHKIPVAKTLFPLGVQANNDMICILDKTKIIICKEDAV